MAFNFKAFGQQLGSSLQSGANTLGKTVTDAAKGVNVQRQLGTIGQAAREQFGTTEADDVTELPEEYLSLERRVDALKNTHQSLLKITYDYPSFITESVAELSQTSLHTLTAWTSTMTKGTNLPQPTVTEKPTPQHKTLSHALSRAAAAGAVDLGGSTSGDRLGAGLQSYALAQEKVGEARLEQDHAISRSFNGPWQATLNAQIAAAMKSRAAVKQARLYLDNCRSRHKSAAGTQKADAVQREVEQAEESLVNATEVAIDHMRAVLESPSSIHALAQLVKAQQTYHAKSAAFLSAIEADLDDAAVAAEAYVASPDCPDTRSDFRKTRS